MRSRLLRGAVASALALSVTGLAFHASAATPASQHWVGAWGAPPQSGQDPANDQSYRLLVHPSLGGSTVRLRFTNEYGTKPLELRDVTIALPKDGLTAGLEPGSMRHVYFSSTGGRRSSVRISPGQDAVSLPVAFTIPSNAWIAVSFYAPGKFAHTTAHGLAWGLNWTTLSRGGDHASDTSGDAFVMPTESWAYLTGIEMLASSDISTVVTLGDSITDGLYSLPDTNTRWPDVLNRRFEAAPGGQRFSVVNAGINGNLVSDLNAEDTKYGDAGFRRIAHDVLAVPNVSTLIVMEGINDIGAGISAKQITDAYLSIIRQAHAKGVKVVFSTLTPSAGTVATNGEASLAKLSGTRTLVNAWLVKHRDQYDGLLHMGESVQSALSSVIWDPHLTIGDQTHPNPLGVRRLVDAIPFSLFKA